MHDTDRVVVRLVIRMLRYDLDRLGWYDFEALTQVLLKAQLGLAVESWSNSARGDWGRDAFYNGALRFPTNELTSGEFVFQCKFVHGANGAGASPDDALLRAVRAERKRIEARGERRPDHYALLTNVSLTPELRTKSEDLLRAVMPKATIHHLGGQDICDLLDLTGHVVHAFPQILGIRQLAELLQLWSRPDIVTRSRALIERAIDEVSTFVPTVAYANAIDLLHRKGLVVLEGPPEMGKTTIGRLLALAAVSAGNMEAVECRRPKDLTAAHERERRQVFVVDDCFGRGSYDPSLGTEWEREFGTIVHLLDRDHWLVLTSRAHLLNFALSTLDIERRPLARVSECRVVVDAASLSSLEKAHILYRHCKQAGFSPRLVELVKASALSIVHNRHFTPERIRILTETLPKRGSTPVHEVVRSCLETPTASMRKSFRRLPPCQQWLLFALLEHQGHGYNAGVRASYERLCPVDIQQPFELVAATLDQAFIKRRTDGIDVVHPTVLDLLVEELASNVGSRRRYLEHCRGRGVMVAVIIQGGANGQVFLPLLNGDAEWTILERRAEMELLEGHTDALLLLSHAADNKQVPVAARRATEVVGRVAERVVAQMTGRWDLKALKAFIRVASREHVPVVDDLWAGAVEDVKAASASTWVTWQNYQAIQDLATLVDLVDTGRITVEDQQAYWSGFCRAVEAWSARSEWKHTPEGWLHDENLEEQHEGYETIGSIMDALLEALRSAPEQDLAPEINDDISYAAACVEDIATWCQGAKALYESAEYDRREEEYYYGASSPSVSVQRSTERPIDIKTIFDDL